MGGFYIRTKEHRELMSRILKGRKLSEETKKKISERHKGKQHSELTKKKLSELNIGKKNKMYGLKHSEEAKKKMSLKAKQRFKQPINNPNWKGGKPKCIDCNRQLKWYHTIRCKKCFHQFKKGENATNWKGGITPINMKIRHSLEIKLWRKSCFERDNFICQKCLIKGGKLNVHHINNFANFKELKTAINNGITLCKNCHIEFHKKYGKRNNTKEQLNEFLKNE